ncbi:hypothetical protein QN277_009855 [Acacia crassicarpa]|uniref:NB-ARC domain-containing protein n=1 Tax=Acacia crassicarpa TaxID=499986 RepID=A0AAE1IQM2_9FABA|nr:hypothetical protein QN277_009855 [Acacia crassicarpa]
MNGIRNIQNALSAAGDTAAEMVTKVAWKLATETTTGTFRKFTDLEEIRDELNQQWTLLCALRDKTELEVQICREKVTTSSYDSWMKAVSVVDADVDVLLTEYREIQPPNQFWRRPDLSSKMEKTTLAIKRLIEQAKHMVFQVDKPPERVLKVLDAPCIAGYRTLQGALEEVLGLVQNSKITAIGVHGLKGVGKTAIIQNLNNHEKVAKLFDIVIFVSVSGDHDKTPIEVQQIIARRLKVDKINNDTEEIARKIEKELKNKKYLLILDGVVDSINLTQLGIPNDDSYSKVVLTAQHKQVCKSNGAKRLVKVDQLSPDDAWQMFRDIVGPIIDQPGITEVAWSVCDECSRLPLLIHKIARSFKLKESVECWRAGLQYLKEGWPDYESEGENELYSFLKFCYDELKDEKNKKCFLYTSLYPADSEVCCDYLVECLAAQDLLGDINDTKKYQNARDRGYAILEHLTNVSLLDQRKEKMYVRMNSCMKQLASYISSKHPQHSSYVQTKEELERSEPSKSWQNARWVSLIDSNLETLPIDRECSMLETLLLQKNPKLSEIPPTFFEKCEKKLLVLDLYDTGFKSLPSSVLKLTRLRGLYLNDCKHLKLSNCPLESLKRLEFLDIRGTKVSFLSFDIGYLTNLRCLRIPYFKSEDEAANADYGSLSRLQKLEELIIEVVSYKEWCNDAANVMEQFVSLENLTNLEFSFPTSNILENFLRRTSGKKFRSFRFFVGCENSKHPAILECFEFKIPKYLRYDNSESKDTLAIGAIPPQVDALELVNCNHIRDLSILGTESLKSICGILIEKCNEIHTILPGIVNGTRAEGILPKLQQLHLINLPKLNCVFGGPLHEESLSKLKVLTLKDCSSLKYIFGDGAIQHLSELHSLEVQNCSNFEELFAAANSGNAVLPKLQVLVLTKLPKLRSVRSDQALLWSSLEVLKIYRCSNLRSLPLSKEEATNLRSIEGEQEWWDQLQRTDREHFQRIFAASSEY